MASNTKTIEKDIIDFLQIHFTPQDKMFSFINLGCRQKGYNYKFDLQTRKGRRQKKGIYSCGYIKTDCLEDFKSDIADGNKNKVVSLFNSMDSYLDHYITANGFCSSKERDSKHLFTLHNIVVDIDCHECISEKEYNIALASCHYFLEELFNEIDFPTPNTVVNTGRGIQIWWAIEPVSAKAKKLYDAVRKYIIDRINELLDNIPTLKLFKLDKSASKNYVGYFRFPGSYNSAVNKFGSFEIINSDRLDIFEFAKRFAPSKAYNVNDVKRIESSYVVKGLDTYREKMLYNLLELRDGDAEGCRDLMCLILCNAYLSSGRSREEAIRAVLRLNRNFNKPMSERHLLAYMSSSFEKKYLFTNEKIIEMLGMSKLEQKALKFYPAKDSLKQREEKRQAKKERNEKIVELFMQGKTQIEIAEIVGCSQPTVCRVISKAELNESVEVVKEAIDNTVAVMKEVVNKVKNKVVTVANVYKKHLQPLLLCKNRIIKNNVKVNDFRFLLRRRRQGYIF